MLPRGPSRFVAAIGLAACTTSNTGGSLPIGIDDLPERFADALCNDIGVCCAEAGYPHDPAQCRAAAIADLRAQIERTKSQNGGYDPNAAGACVDAVAWATSTCSELSILASCGKVFAGAEPEGANCTGSAQCASGACLLPVDGSPGRCVGGAAAPPRGKAGDSCRGTCMIDTGGTSCSGGGGGAGAGGSGGASANVDCYIEDGVYCDAATDVCTLTPGLGQPCNLSSVCRGEAFCENRVCVEKPTSGPCTGGATNCASTSYCDLDTFECRPHKARGEACTSSIECATADRCNGTCRRRSIAERGTCRGNL